MDLIFHEEYTLRLGFCLLSISPPESGDTGRWKNGISVRRDFFKWRREAAMIETYSHANAVPEVSRQMFLSL